MDYGLAQALMGRTLRPNPAAMGGTAPAFRRGADWLRERGPRYTRDWYAATARPGRSHPVTATAERRVLSRNRRRWRRILALSERMASGEGSARLREDWLTLEESLHAHWLELAVEHYNLGFEAGRHSAQAVRPAAAAAEGDPLERARALVAAIGKALDEL